jgi:ribosomal protein S21
MGIRIRVFDGEPVAQALRRLKKQLRDHGMAWEMRRRNYFVDPTQLRRAKRFQKRFKARKATLLAQREGKQPVESMSEATAEFWRRTGKP